MSNKTIQGRKIRIAVVGCGRISERHFNAIEVHGNDLQLVAVCDTDENVRNAVARRTNTPGYADLRTLLTREEVDLISLCTPSGLHAEQATICAQAGCHIMTEKPMATCWEDGLRMVRACDEADVRLFVVKQNRGNATLQLLKKAIDLDRFGHIYMVHLNVFWTRPQEYYDSAAWRGTWEFDGGALMNQASHYVDLLDWLIGPVASVQAMTATLARKIEVEDTAVMNVRWRAGTLGSMCVTMLTHQKNLEGSIVIIGEKGTARLGGVAVNQVQHWEFEDRQPEDESVTQASYHTSSVYGFGHPLYFKNVVDTLRGEVEPETDGREGLRSLELLIAAYLSARDGKQINLPLHY